ncbi:MAG: protein kinase domain-containing protein [Planctomycetota bacterium]
MSQGAADDTRDEELLADLFDTLLQEILDGRTPDLAAIHPDRPELRERVHKAWQLACSVAGRREPSRPVLGGYEIVRELGHGGMGTVYLARHLTLQRDVAIKVLPHSLAMSPHAKQRFVEEARALAQLRHDHVVHVHRIIDHAEMLAFEMEYIDGMSLQGLIARLQQCPKPQALATLAAVLGREPSALGARSTVEWFVRVAIRIARALGEVHRAGLVHRDVKPSNILLRADGTPVLADFGLALQGDLDVASGKFAGTPVYAAPERLRGGDGRVDARTDVYSLGVTLYEALTHSPPYRGSSTHEVLKHIEAGRVPSLRRRAGQVSHDLAIVVQKAMEADTRHRYATADDFADDLERLLTLQPIQARPAGPLRRAVKFVRRHQRLFVAGLAGAVLFAGALWPLAAHASARAAAGKRAEAELLAARSVLLAPEILPESWSPAAGTGKTVAPAAASTARREALLAALRHYDAAHDAVPDDAAIACERAVVAAVAALAHGQEIPPATAAMLPPRTRTMLEHAAEHQRLLAGDDDEVASSDDERTSSGWLAFLCGDLRASATCFARLPAGHRDEALAEACTALRLAGEGPAEHAYPQLFHAARAFPRATAITLALADAAIAAGDLAQARARLAELPPAANGPIAARAAILAADLLAAAGDDEAALRAFRERSLAEPSDPVPRLRIAELLLRGGDAARAERVLTDCLRRWPDLADARLALARMALQRHDTATYLEHARAALRQLRKSEAPPAQLLAILRLGGLRTLHDEMAATLGERPSNRRDEAELPLVSWLGRDVVRGSEQVLRLLATFDESADAASLVDTRPLGIGLRATWTTLLRCPGLLQVAPAWLSATSLVGLPAVLGAPTDHLGSFLLPYQSILGNRLRQVNDRRLFWQPAEDCIYGLQVLRVGDLDGDTLGELCFTAPSNLRDQSVSHLEIRSAADGSPLRTWRIGDDLTMFARAAAALGDVDGDLCDDLAIGMPVASLAGDPAAAIEAWSGRTGERIWRTEHEVSSFGAALAAIGDVDGDGVRDLLAGISPLTLQEPGGAQVLSGRTGRVLHTLRGERTGIWFGAAVAAAGDVTGDGVDDLLVGGNYGDAPGHVAVFDGHSGAVVTTFGDDDASSRFGHTLLGVGDLDRDGRADLAIAAPGQPNSNTQPGRVLVFSSRTNKRLYELRGDRPRDLFGLELCHLPDWRHASEPAIAVAAGRGGPIGNGYVRVFALPDGAPLQTMAGHHGQHRFGVSLVDLGDRDGDGRRELGVTTLHGNRNAEFYVMTLRDAFPGGPMRGSPEPPRSAPKRPAGVLPK